VAITDAPTIGRNMSLSILSLMLVGVFSQKFLILFDFHPSSDSLPCQILPEEIPMQEQESDSLPIENNHAIADIQTVDSPVQHTTNGKKVICLARFSTTNMN